MSELDQNSKVEQSLNQPATRRVGAASDSSDLNSASDVSFAPTPEDLPMIVWLVGTEPWFSEFSLEADHVMASLGIKRTRLTQIAGRELRVGRVRRGRYISPVFRPEDVEQYLNWSRAPSTHIKSSTMLSEAADMLKEQAELLESHFLELKASMTSDFETGIRRAVLHSEEMSAASRAQIQRSFLQFSEQIADRFAVFSKRQDNFSQQFNQLTNAVEKLQAGQMAILQTLQEFQVRNATEMAHHARELTSSLKKVEEQITVATDDGPVNLRINRAVVRAQKMQRPRLQQKKMQQIVSDDQQNSKRVSSVRKRMLRSKS
jgi:hypothetical protein